ncbi:3'-5' exoribonuclease [Vagococcus sp. BWB3-3]|uniref:DNA polymerase III polC-type n=1 Tax=Vagococcus allomyrinae TaxID=2794353 RepID=A0A940SU59_9ENTE|nr:exonuclease domain-containing protein [Vagococcus allomyrinae]MBP1040409.1 3'-5' exoribonuclease [Vagococcus allomyrinae]
MSINFVAIDFETANAFRASACSVGMVKVINGEVVDTFYSLINPEDDFDSFNSHIHGITEDMVTTSPPYDLVIKEIEAFLENLPLVAHYAPFDMGVIRDSNDRYNIFDFEANYFDSYYLSRKYLNLLSYKLVDLANLINFDFEHHNALEDAKACAALILYLCQNNSFDNVADLLNHVNYTKMGEISGSKGSGFRIRKIKKTGNKSLVFKEIIESVSKNDIDESHFFYNKHVCFTGKLESFSRNEAALMLAEVGGIPEIGVTKKVNFLVMGEQDIRVVGDSLKSSKILKAEKLLASGQDIQLLGESDFLKMIW